MKMFDHPNIITIHEIIDDPQDDKLQMIMEYCQHGQILTVDEVKITFTPSDTLLEQASYFNILDREYNLNPLDEEA